MNTAASVFHGRLFGPGLAGSGSPAEGRWQDDALVLQAGECVMQVPASDLQIEASGFNLQQMRMSWQSAEGGFAFFIEQPEQRERFLAQAPATIVPAAGNASKMQRRTESRFRAAFLAYGIYLALPLILLLAFVLNTDRIAGWVADKVPLEYEQKIGNMVLAQVRAQGTLFKSGPAYEAVQTIGSRLTAGSRYNYQWFVAEENVVNAFAAPGGVIVVYAGLIAETDRPEELAGVLAHEVAHVEQRHSLKNLIKSAGFSMMLALVLGDWSGSAAWISQLTELKFSRDAEMDADREGLRRLTAAGIAPDGMVDFFAKLAQKENRPGALAMLGTHPPSQDRMEALRRQIAELPARPYQALNMDWPAIKASLSNQKAGQQ